MRKKIGFLAIILIGLLAFSSCKLIPIKIAPDVGREFKRLGIDFTKKESILRLEQEPELFELWARWKPIKLSMTEEERKKVKEIRKIEDVEERNFSQEKLIEFFWKRRDTNLYDEDENKVRDAFYNRVIVAQTKFGNKEGVYTRKCKYGKGWQTDMGLMYILSGEPFDRARHNVSQLMSFFRSSSQQQSAFMPQEIEVWYYDVPLDEYYGGLFQDGVAWILFEKDSSGYWTYGRTTFSLFYNYENYQMSYLMGGMSLTYSRYVGEIDKFLKAVARENIYDEDLTYEEMFYKWIKENEKKEDK